MTISVQMHLPTGVGHKSFDKQFASLPSFEKQEHVLAFGTVRVLRSLPSRHSIHNSHSPTLWHKRTLYLIPIRLFVYLYVIFSYTRSILFGGRASGSFPFFQLLFAGPKISCANEYVLHFAVNDYLPATLCFRSAIGWHEATTREEITYQCLRLSVYVVEHMLSVPMHGNRVVACCVKVYGI